MATIGKATKLSVATLAIMNVTAVVSLRGLPAEAEYGMSSAFYYLFAAIVFLIPTALVAAELAAMFSDKQGGVFRWVGEAFGPRTGFLAIWLIFVKLTKTKHLHKFNGQIFYSYIIWYGIGRFWIEGMRTDSLYLIPNVIRVSQLVALLSFIAGTALMVYSFVMLKKGKENALVTRVKPVLVEETGEESNGTNN